MNLYGEMSMLGLKHPLEANKREIGAEKELPEKTKHKPGFEIYNTPQAEKNRRDIVEMLNSLTLAKIELDKKKPASDAEPALLSKREEEIVGNSMRIRHELLPNGRVALTNFTNCYTGSTIYNDSLEYCDSEFQKAADTLKNVQVYCRKADNKLYNLTATYDDEAKWFSFKLYDSDGKKIEREGIMFDRKTFINMVKYALSGTTKVMMLTIAAGENPFLPQSSK